MVILKSAIQVALFCILLFSLTFFYLRMGALDPVFNQVQALQTGDTIFAYDQTSDEFRKTHSILDFVKLVGVLNNNANIILLEKNIAATQGTVKAQIRTPMGHVIVVYQLIREKNSWKIRSIRFT